MSRSGRLFEIIQILRSSKQPVTAAMLSKKLEVDRRTIYRDMAGLQAMRVPIVGEAGVGYIMRAGFDLPPLMFSVEELEAIAVGLALLGRTSDQGLMAAADGVRDKIADVLPTHLGSHFRNPALHVSSWSAVPLTAVIYRNVRQAIRAEQELRIFYTDEHGRVTDRTIRPIALIYYVESVLLAGWCLMRRDFRHFRIDRASVCEPTGSHFTGEGAQLRTEWQRVTAASQGWNGLANTAAGIS